MSTNEWNLIESLTGLNFETNKPLVVKPAVEENLSFQEKYNQWLNEGRKNSPSEIAQTRNKIVRIFSLKHLENEELMFILKNDFSELSISNLIIGICCGCIDSNNKFDDDLFEKRHPILSNYKDELMKLRTSDRTSEIEILNEINQINKNKTDLTRTMFSILSSKNIIREGAFWKWRRLIEKEGNLKTSQRLADFFGELSEKRKKESTIKINNTATEMDNNKEKKKRWTRKEKRQLLEIAKSTSELVVQNSGLNNPFQSFPNPISQINASLNEPKSTVALNQEAQKEKLVEIFQNFGSDIPILFEKIKVKFNKLKTKTIDYFIFNHYKAEFGKMETLSKKSIKTLVNALCHSCLSAEKQFDTVFFVQRCLILPKLMNKNITIELEALNTIETFFIQEPSFNDPTLILRILFSHLKTNEIINVETLNIWYKKSRLLKNPMTNEQGEPKAHKEPRNRKQPAKKDETIDQAKVGRVDQAKVGRVEQAKVGRVEQAKVGRVEQAKIQKRHKEPNILADKTPTLANSQQSIVQTINDSLEQRLLTFLKDRTLTNEKMFANIEMEFSGKERISKEFIRGLITLTCKSCLSEINFDSVLFKQRCPVLNLFINQTENGQLEALISIQALCLDLDNFAGMILTFIFDILYMEKIISENSFLKWKLQADTKSIELSREFFYKIDKINETKKKDQEEKKIPENIVPNQQNFYLYGNYMQPNSIQPAFAAQMPVQYVMPTPFLTQPVQYANVQQVPYNSFNPIQSNQENRPRVFQSFNNSNNRSTNNIKFKDKNQFSKPGDRSKQNDKPREHYKPDDKQHFNRTKQTVEHLAKQVDVAKIPQKTEESDSACPICIESISNLKALKIRLKSTVCGHIICGPCTENLLKKVSKQVKTVECPICRTNLNESSIHDIFL